MTALNTNAFRLTARAIGGGSVAPDPRTRAGGYRWRGIPGWKLGDEIPPRPRAGADAYVEKPSEIVARLHARIAAKSPEHARLVAAFESIPEDLLGAWDPLDEHPPAEDRPVGGPRRRREGWLWLRTCGISPEEARAQLGVSTYTARRYEKRLATQEVTP
jgi:hypothetical protein